MNEQQTTDTTNVQTTESAQTAATDTTPGQAEHSQPEQQSAQQQENNTAAPETDPAVPETADAYSVSIDGFDFEAFKADNGEVLQAFHAEGMNNKQVEAVLKAYEQHTSVQIDALKEEWGQEFDANVSLAKQAISALGFEPKDLDSPTAVIRLAAAIGKQIQEDFPPLNAQQSGSETIQQLMMSEAYSNPSHPDHKSVTERVDAWYAKQYQD